MTSVFISYRRHTDTTSGYASWIYDRLADRLGRDRVFMDIDSLPLGVDFVEQVERAVVGADVALILIGPNWLNATDEAGRRRLDDPEDFVRIEVAAALRSSPLVIPVLVDGAQVPKPDQLPQDLQPLTRRHALTFQRQGGAAIQQIFTAIERAPANAKPMSAAGAKEPGAAEAKEQGAAGAKEQRAVGAKEKGERHEREEQATRLVLGALQRSRNVGQGYRTAAGLARATGLSEAEVNHIIENCPELVMKSRIPARGGAALFKLRT
ncbi:MAG: TIR domain-containing protein [Solirubrobacterales bacterium]|nr:TIR domain-containing protein [Solirubrobacterales bacterium]